MPTNKPNDIAAYQEDTPPSVDTGFCDVSFTVTKAGSTKYVEILYCSDEMFKTTSIKAAKQYRYDPKIVNGEAVEVKGVAVRVNFQIKK